MKTKIQALHEQALVVAKRYLQAEGELIDLLQKIDEGQGYRKLNYPSLYLYATQALRLSEAVSLSLITVARKSFEVPELKAMIQSNEITLSNARVITSVLKPENKDHWLESARELSKRDLEKEVAKENPRVAVPERVKPVAENLMKLELGITDQIHEDLKRAQDLCSSQSGKPATLEDTLRELLKFYLDRKDPVKRAERAQAREERKGQVVDNKPEFATQPELSPGRVKDDQGDLITQGSVRKQPISQDARPRIPARLIHQINLRDGQRCAHIDKNGKRCTERRWLDIHHVQPLFLGGSNSLENLTTLCKAHHDMLHDGVDM